MVRFPFFDFAEFVVSACAFAHYRPGAMALQDDFHVGSSQIVVLITQATK